MTATAVKTGKTEKTGARGTALYAGPLWYFKTAGGGVVVGRDDITNKLVCTCAAYRRSQWRCQHIARVTLNRRRDSVFTLPDREADEIRVRFAWLLTLLGVDPTSKQPGGVSVTLRRLPTHERSERRS